jgi:hypothetical protein
MRALGRTAIALIAAAAACAPTAVPPSAPTPTVPTSASATAGSTPRPPIASTVARGATFIFEPGLVRWCGVFGTPVASDLRIGGAVFAGSATPPFIGSDVRPGGWVCLSGTVVRSEISSNQLADVSVTTAPVGTWPSGPIRASACGLITELFVGDMPSGGFITLNGTKFLVGGARPAGELVALPPQELRVGQSLCISGTRLEPYPDGSFNAVGGRAVVMP